MALDPTSSRGGGDAPTVTAIRFPITFDTPGLVPTSYPIIAADPGVYPITAVDVGDGVGSFSVAGDHTVMFPVGGPFTVTGSTGNDGAHAVVASSFAAGHTTVEVVGSLDPTPDGELVVAKTITVAGDRRAAFAVGVAFVIAGSSANDQSGTVVSASLFGGNTVIDGNFFALDPTADGDAVVAVGATVYTPAVGDILIGSAVSPATLATVSQAWNGATPKLKVLTEAYRQAQSDPFVSLDATVADDPAGASLALSAGFSFGETSSWMLWRFTTADPILVQVDDNNGLDPGATQGAASVVLLLLPAA